jgi:hypothetical protein
MELVRRVVRQKIRVESAEVGVVGLIVAVLCSAPDVCKRGGIHPVQSAKVEDERLAQRRACGDGRKRIGEVLKLAKAGKCRRRM